MCINVAQKKYIEGNFMGISKNVLYYQYCILNGTQKILSILMSWGGLLQNPQKQLKTAKNSKILITSLRCWPRKSIACRNIIVLQIFYLLYELSKIKFSHFVCIHKAHFLTPKNQMLTREKSKFEQFFDNL